MKGQIEEEKWNNKGTGKLYLLQLTGNIDANLLFMGQQITLSPNSLFRKLKSLMLFNSDLF